MVQDLDRVGASAALVDEAEPDPAESGPEADAKLLVWLCHRAINQYGLRVTECDAPGAPSSWGPVHNVHAKGSLHYQHRAADILGAEANMRQYCAWVGGHYQNRIAELIHNPGCSIKNGSVVPPSYWGDKTWQSHKTHVHLGI